MIRRRRSCFSPHPVCLMCLTAFLIAMSQPSKDCCCWGVGWILCNLSTLGFGWVFFSLVSSVLCILLILVKASFLSLPKQNAVWMPGFSHTGNLHLMLQFSSLSCFKNLQSVVGRRMSLPMLNWVFLVFLFVSVFCIFATCESVLSTKENAVQTFAWNWLATCGFLHCYILFSILGTCIQCVQITPSCTSSSFQRTGSVLYFVFYFFLLLNQGVTHYEGISVCGFSICCCSSTLFLESIEAVGFVVWLLIRASRSLLAWVVPSLCTFSLGVCLLGYLYGVLFLLQCRQSVSTQLMNMSSVK